MSRFKNVWFLLSFAALTGACTEPEISGPPPQDLLQGQPLVEISRTTTGGEATKVAALRQALASGTPTLSGGESFYLALSRKELGQKWFLSAQMKQLHPGGVALGAGYMVGTRVVTFRVQNEKLYVLDASGLNATSDVFDPTLVIEAYPLIKGIASFESRPGKDGYVLFDPAAGLNRFGFANDFVTGLTGTPLGVDLALSNRFRALPDGALYEQVWTGLSEQMVGDPSATTASLSSPFRISGTLALSFRRYAESSTFSPTPLPEVPHYFDSEPRSVRNQGRSESFALKWNIFPGMKPIRWVVSDDHTKLSDELAGYDIASALKRGIEKWNDVYGFPVFTVDIGPIGDAFTDDDRNVLIFDPDVTQTQAFAQTRSNPVTGEVRSAMIYFGAGLVQSVHEGQKGLRKIARGASKTAKKLTWGDFDDGLLCSWDAAHFAPSRMNKDEAAAALAVEDVVAFIASHEVGHTLGLRHNFKGSLGEQPTSVMDYYTDQDIISQTLAKSLPGSYDAAAVRYLAGLATDLPTQEFCTDEMVDGDPKCTPFDRGVDPLRARWIPLLTDTIEDLWTGDATPDRMGALIRNLVHFVYLGSPNEQTDAWKALLSPLADNPAGAPPSAFVDLWWTEILKVAFPQSGQTANSLAPETRRAVAASLVALTIDQPGTRLLATRRIAVDALKRMQTSEGLAGLTAARDAISATSAARTVEVDDLVRRIDVALHPYFN